MRDHETGVEAVTTTALAVAQMDSIGRAIALAETPEEAVEVERRIKAVVSYLKSASENKELANRAVGKHIQALRKVGEMLSKEPRKPGFGSDKERTDPFNSSFRDTLRGYGISHGEASRFEVLYRQLTDFDIETLISEANRKNKLLSINYAVGHARSKEGGFERPRRGKKRFDDGKDWVCPHCGRQAIHRDDFNKLMTEKGVA